MAVVTTNLVTQVQDRIDNLSGTETLKELLVLRKAADGLDLDLTDIEAAITAEIAALDGTSDDKDLLLANRAASLIEPSVGGGIPIGGIIRLMPNYPILIELDGQTFLKNGYLTSSGFDPSLINYNIPVTYSAGTGTSGTLQGCSINDNGQAIAVNSAGAVFYSSNNGVSWTAGTGTTGNLQGCSINDKGQAIAVNTSGALFYSSNNGVSWTAGTGTTGSLQGCSINDNGQAIAVNSAGAVFYSNTAVGLIGLSPSDYLRIL